MTSILERISDNNDTQVFSEVRVSSSQGQLSDGNSGGDHQNPDGTEDITFTDVPSINIDNENGQSDENKSLKCKTRIQTSSKAEGEEDRMNQNSTADANYQKKISKEKVKITSGMATSFSFRIGNAQNDKQIDTGKEKETEKGFLSVSSSTASSSMHPSETPSAKINLTVSQSAKIDNFVPVTKDNSPSRITVILKWLATIIFGLIMLACMATNVLTFVFISMLTILKGTQNNVRTHFCDDVFADEGNTTEVAFVMVILILVVPNVINLFRSIWVGGFRKDKPWPAKRSIFWIVFVTFFESLGISIFAFKVYSTSLGVIGLLGTQGIYFFPVLFLWKYGRRARRVRNIPSWKIFVGILSAVTILICTCIVCWRAMQQDGVTSVDIVYLLVATGLVSISWIPSVQKKLISTQKKNTTIFTESLNGIVGSLDSSDSGLSSTVTGTTMSNHSEPVQEPEVQSKQSFWKSAIIISFFRILFLILFSYFVYGFLTKEYSWENFVNISEDVTINGWSWQNDCMIEAFVGNLTSLIVLYFLGAFACSINMHRGAFVIPVLLTTPLVIIMMTFNCPFTDDLDQFLGIGQAEEKTVILVLMGVTFVSIVISLGRVLWATNNRVLLKESQLMWSAAFPGILMEQWMLTQRRNKWTDREFMEPTDVERKTRIYICTTMYHESEKEMEQLLKSLGKISEAQAQSNRHFESHIIFDKGVRDKTLTDYALQLVGLLPRAVGIGDDGIEKVTKSTTPYGMQLSWRLPNQSVGGKQMNITIHLKDERKVKPKKRWSQIMYMSYVLDFATKSQVNADGNTKVNDDDAFILTTDADVEFNPESVEALLDLMSRDSTVGAVCARTHPLGAGPLVWYQKFEYAIGHWFQKAAEHVLGSVLCAPGCFSVYRVSAVRDILPIYATGVDEAYEFLIKDMGEDRWFCTLLVQSGWRIEYCAAAENATYCPQEFEEFYKQRRRWIASTIANLYLLITEWSKIKQFNHRVSYLFCVYQTLLLFSTIIGPSVVILIVTGGLFYGVGMDTLTSLLLQVIICGAYILICLKMSQSKQFLAGKIITFVYACAMMLVAVGTAQQVVSDLQTEKPGQVEGNSSATPPNPTLNPSDISFDVPLSVTTIYLGGLVGIFLVTGLFHPNEFLCLLHGLWYLLCLPSGYLVLNIYSICNVTDRSWGTREGKDESKVKEDVPWYEKVRLFFQWACVCCVRSPEEEKRPTVAESQENLLQPRVPNAGSDQSKLSSKPRAFDAQVSYQASSIAEIDDQLTGSAIVNMEDEENVILSVEEWLDQELKEYLPLFKAHGYDNTMFISNMTKSELKKIGIKKVSHINFLLREIKDLPLYPIETKVPEDVQSWLREIGLSEYEHEFRKNKLKSARDLEILRSSTMERTEEILKHDIKVTKRAHIRRFLLAVRHLRNPTKEEKLRLEVKKKLDLATPNQMEEWGKEEHEFWTALVELCLKPSSDVFGHNEHLQGKLEELRNGIVLLSAIANVLWLILLSALASKIDLKVYGADPVGLVFVAIFGGLFVIQFLCMLCHRVLTLSHFLARIPYRFGHQYMDFWSFNDVKTEAVRDPEFLRARRVARQAMDSQFMPRLRRGQKKRHYKGQGETTPLLNGANNYGMVSRTLSNISE